MSRTQTPAPTDKSMWRRLLARTHPDHGGDDELFVWARELQQHVATAIEKPRHDTRHDTRRPTGTRDATKPTTNGSGGGDNRIPFDPSSDHEDLIHRAAAIASETPEPHASILWLLSDCPLRANTSKEAAEQTRGAKYKRLAAIGHKVRMTKAERSQWYRIAESVPLSDRHAGYILSRLNEERENRV